jgi:hypothetical protein
MARLRQILGDNGEPTGQDDGGQFSALGKPDQQRQDPTVTFENPAYQPPNPGGENPGREPGNSTSPMEAHMGQGPNQPLSAGHATPPQPMSPSIDGTGSVAPAFQPLPGPGLETLMTSRRRGLYGSTGGLTGGGIGAPSAGPDQSISALIQALLGGRQ